MVHNESSGIWFLWCHFNSWYSCTTIPCFSDSCKRQFLVWSWSDRASGAGLVGWVVAVYARSQYWFCIESVSKLHIPQQLLNQIDVGHHHAPTTVTFKANLVHCYPSEKISRASNTPVQYHLTRHPFLDHLIAPESWDSAPISHRWPMAELSVCTKNNKIELGRQLSYYIPFHTRNSGLE